MTPVVQDRYRLDADDRGHDLLLDRPVTVLRLPSVEPGRLARGLRGLAGSPWLPVVDACERDDDVVLVLPATEGSFAEQAAAGLPAHRADALGQQLDPVLDGLARLGLAPRSLDPAQIPTTADGAPVLLVTRGPRPSPAQEAALLAALGGTAAAPADSRIEDAVTTVIPVLAASTVTLPTAVAAAEPAAVPAAHTVPRPSPPVLRAQPSRPRRRRGRTAAVGLGTAAAVLAVGFVATADDTRRNPTGDQLRAAAGTSGGAAVGADALDGVLADLQADPTAPGPGGGDLLVRLRAVRTADGPQQAFAAAGVLETLRRGTEAGSLTGPLVDRARQAAAPLAQPADLPSLIDMAQVDPAAFGPRTPKFLGRLVSLRDKLTGEPARTEAQDLRAIVAAGPAKGQFTPTFAALAGPVLTDLAVPKDLAALLAAARVEPTRFGPRTPKFLGRLDSLQRLSGQARVVEAQDLLGIVQAGVGKGEFTASFRDIAVPVLRPLADGTA